jgi:hypothetical protein
LPTIGSGQVLLDAAVALQQIRHEELGQVRLVAHGGDHRGLGNSRDHAVVDRGSRREAQRMAIQASFPEEVTGPEDGDDGLLALRRDDGELDPALLDVENRVCRLSLRENDVLLAIAGNRLAVADIGEKSLGIE